MILVYCLLTFFGFFPLGSFGDNSGGHQGISAYLVPSLNYTYLHITVPRNIEDFSGSFYIEDLSLDIFGIFTTLHSNSLLIRESQAVNRIYSQGVPLYKSHHNQCIKVPRLFDRSLLLFTVLQPCQTHIKLKLKTPTDTFTYKRLIEAPIHPIYYYERFKANSVYQGASFYPLFTPKHLERNLSLYREHFPDTSFRITTFPRSGTHVYVGTLQEVFEEFIGMFEHDVIDPTHFDTMNGFLRPSKGFTRITIGHGFRELILNRIIFTGRDPVEMVDSRFRLWQDPAKMDVVYKKGFQKEPLFREYLEESFALADKRVRWMFEPVHMFYVSYNEMKASSEKVFCEMISFMDRFPCEYSWLPKLRRVLGEKGLVSSYNSTKPNEKDEHEKTKALYSEYGQELVDIIFKSSFGYVAHLFGANVTYHEVFSPNYTKPAGYKAPYQIRNQIVLNNTLYYRDLFVAPFVDVEFRDNFLKNEKIKIEKEKMSQMVNDKAFRKYIKKAKND